MANPRRAILLDDHHIVIDALRTALGAMRLFDRIETANTLTGARELLEANPACDLAILDLHLGDAQGREVVTGIRERFPDVPVLVFSGDGSVENITMAFECGARGYVTKTSPMTVVGAAIRLVLAGGVYVPPEAVRMMGAMPASSAASVEEKPALRLSGRQKEVFDLLLQGMPNKVIAARLDMAEGTAKAHLNTVYRVLGVRTRVEAILKARQLGMI